MASIGKKTSRVVDDVLHLDFEVTHPAHEAGTWFEDVITVNDRSTRPRVTVSAKRQVAAGTTATKVSVACPPIALGDDWLHPITVTIKSAPLEATEASFDPFQVQTT